MPQGAQPVLSTATERGRTRPYRAAKLNNVPAPRDEEQHGLNALEFCRVPKSVLLGHPHGLLHHFGRLVRLLRAQGDGAYRIEQERVATGEGSVGIVGGVEDG